MGIYGGQGTPVVQPVATSRRTPQSTTKRESGSRGRGKTRDGTTSLVGGEDAEDETQEDEVAQNRRMTISKRKAADMAIKIPWVSGSIRRMRRKKPSRAWESRREEKGHVGEDP